MSLIGNLQKIEQCKEAIKNALIEKGVKDMDGLAFSGYAGKIKDLQLSSGDTPSTPTPSADYIYLFRRSRCSDLFRGRLQEYLSLQLCFCNRYNGGYQTSPEDRKLRWREAPQSAHPAIQERMYLRQVCRGLQDFVRYPYNLYTYLLSPSGSLHALHRTEHIRLLSSRAEHCLASYQS